MDTETHETLSRLGMRRDARALEFLSWGIVVVMGVMITLVLLSMPGSGGVTSQLNRLAGDSTMYRLAFAAASLVNPMLFAALALFSWLEHRRRSLRPVEVIGWGFVVAYLPLVLVAYVSQYTLLPKLLVADRAAAATWFFYEETSIASLFDVLGYGLFGLGAMLLSTVLITRHGLVGWTGVLLGLTGLAGFVGLVGFAAGLEVLTWGTVIGGLLIVPLAVLFALDGRRCRKG